MPAVTVASPEDEVVIAPESELVAAALELGDVAASPPDSAATPEDESSSVPAASSSAPPHESPTAIEIAHNLRLFAISGLVVARAATDCAPVNFFFYGTQPDSQNPLQAKFWEASRLPTAPAG